MDEQVSGKDNSRSDTQERLSVLKDLIRDGEASTQDELCDALRRKKFDVTQSTVSRDLRKIGALKATNEGGEIIYIMPEDHRALAPKMNHDLTGLVIEVQANENMIVLHTTPGSASLVAAHMDRLRSHFGILGTVSGDDTIFAVPISAKRIASVVKKMKEQYL